MQIDWFTLVAEIVNFLILLWLLQRFLYRPIISAMEKREQTIANHLREAEEEQRRAEEEVAKYEAMQREFDDQRDEMMQTARHEAETRRQKLLEEMRTEAEEARRSWQLAVQQEKAAFLNELEERLGESAVDVARHVLADMADAKLESQVVRVFVRRLDEASADTRDRIVEALHSKTVRVDSAFELDPDDRIRLEGELHELAPDLDGGALNLDYHVARDMICGLRLTTGEYELSWAFADYTAALRAQFNRALEEGLDESLIDAEVAQKDGGADDDDAAEPAAEAAVDGEPASALDIDQVSVEADEDGSDAAACQYDQR